MPPKNNKYQKTHHVVTEGMAAAGRWQVAIRAINEAGRRGTIREEKRHRGE